jgi:hypothetical protein
MHAGDGNVQVNVPVLSNDRAMLDRADRRIDEVMAKVIALGGVVSGEHGIGVTKLKYLEPERIAELAAYRREVDPGGLMNPGKLEDYAVLDYIFTPSFNLLELEARILQHGRTLAQDCALRTVREVQAELLRLPSGARDVLSSAEQEPGNWVLDRGAAVRRAAQALYQF